MVGDKDEWWERKSRWSGEGPGQITKETEKDKAKTYKSLFKQMKYYQLGTVQNTNDTYINGFSAFSLYRPSQQRPIIIKEMQKTLDTYNPSTREKQPSAQVL